MRLVKYKQVRFHAGLGSLKKTYTGLKIVCIIIITKELSINALFMLD